MKTKHTSGLHCNGSKIIGENGFPVAQLYQNASGHIKISDSEFAANIKLLASAEEMLERLEYVVSWLEDAKVHEDIVRHCKSTIKKATNGI